jgi:hypothetical protein
MSTITHDALKECFKPVQPLNGFLIAEVTDKPSERVLASGLVIKESTMDNDRPYLVVKDMSPEAQEKFPMVHAGDIIEVMQGNREIAFVYGHDMEKLAIVESKYISAVYHRIPGTVIKDTIPVGRSKIIPA